jgi:hypothetical protein
MNWGYEVCGNQSPEMKAASNNAAYSELGLDNFRSHGDVVLVRIPEHLYEIRQKDRDAAAKAALDGASDSFIDKGRELEDRYSYAKSAEGPLYYKGPGHYVGNPGGGRQIE